MSEHTQETSHHRSRKDQSADTTALQSGNGEDHAASVPTVEVEIAGIKVELPLKFAAGHILTDHQAKVLDTAYQRQFRNNQEANFKARAARLEKATTEAERVENRPLTAAEVTGLYIDYQPAVGDTVRMSTLERMRQDAAWRFWVARVSKHNATVGTGEAPVITKAVMPDGKPRMVELGYSIPTVAKKGEDKDVFAARKAAAVDARMSFCSKILDMAEYAADVQAQLDLIIAEKAASKADSGEAAADVIVSGDSLL